MTTRTDRYETTGPPPKNPVNRVIYDSDWEAEFCRVAESNRRVIAYTKNHNLGFEVPYRYQGSTRCYYPDFILLVDDGHGPDNPPHLVVEIKGYRGEDAKDKASTMNTYWVPGVNNLGTYGRSHILSGVGAPGAIFFFHHFPATHQEAHKMVYILMQEEHMRTTVTLDDQLLKEAEELTGITERSRLIRDGLEALIQREAARRLARLGGTMPDFQDIPRRRSSSDDSR
jgi:Arc/MetJ family transcription regulator